MEVQRRMRTQVLGVLAGAVGVLSLAGCMATQGWVTDQMAPLEGQVDRLEKQEQAQQAKLAAVESTVKTLKLERQIVGEVVEGINFATGSDQLTDEGREAMDLFIDGLGDTTNVHFYLAGYTDIRGTERRNYELGERRATRVARYLITEKGIRPAWIRTGSHGMSNPLADNASAEGLLLNRRVALYAYREMIMP